MANGHSKKYKNLFLKFISIEKKWTKMINITKKMYCLRKWCLQEQENQKWVHFLNKNITVFKANIQFFE